MVIESVKCKECNAPIEMDMDSEFAVCSYCGAKYINQQAVDRKERELEHEREQERSRQESFIGKIENEVNHVFKKSKKEKKMEGPRPKLNGCAFTLLILFCWPGAIAYYIYTKSMQDKWDDQN